MASLFESLPPEMLQKCVEFLDFDLDAKLAAKFTREYLAEYADPWSAYDNETNQYDTYAWASDWQDATKADAFVAEMEEIWAAETGNEHYDYYNDY